MVSEKIKQRLCCKQPASDACNRNIDTGVCIGIKAGKCLSRRIPKRAVVVHFHRLYTKTKPAELVTIKRRDDKSSLRCYFIYHVSQAIAWDT